MYLVTCGIPFCLHAIFCLDILLRFMSEDTRSVGCCILLSRRNHLYTFVFVLCSIIISILYLCAIYVMWYFLFEHPSLLFLSFNSLTPFCPSQYNRGRRSWRSPFRLQWGWTESLGSDSACQRRDLVLASRVQLSFARKFSSLCRVLHHRRGLKERLLQSMLSVNSFGTSLSFSLFFEFSC